MAGFAPICSESQKLASSEVSQRTLQRNPVPSLSRRENTYRQRFETRELFKIRDFCLITKGKIISADCDAIKIMGKYGPMSR